MCPSASGSHAVEYGGHQMVPNTIKIKVLEKRMFSSAENPPEDFNCLLFLWESQQSLLHPRVNSFNTPTGNPKLLAQLFFFFRLPILSWGRSVYWPLNTIRESRTVVGGGGVVTAHSVQEVIVCRHTHSSSPLGHGSAHAPLVGVRIEALHRPQTRAAISSTYGKQSGRVVQNGFRIWNIFSNMHLHIKNKLAGIIPISWKMSVRIAADQWLCDRFS